MEKTKEPTAILYIPNSLNLEATIFCCQVLITVEEANRLSNTNVVTLNVVKASSYKIPFISSGGLDFFEAISASKYILSKTVKNCCLEFSTLSAEVRTLEALENVNRNAYVPRDVLEIIQLLETQPLPYQIALFSALEMNASAQCKAAYETTPFHQRLSSLFEATKIHFKEISDIFSPGLRSIIPRIKNSDVLNISGTPSIYVDSKLDTSGLLPKPDKENILITAALPYVNNVPHLGNIIGAVLSADVFARYCRLRGRQTLFICGTDEYGTATETRALEEGISCAELCAKYFRLHASIYHWFDISFNRFGRSSTNYQTKITHEIFNALYDNGYFFTNSVEQAYCVGCTRFLADRYVEGTCPVCKYDDARGDQCDSCGRLLDPAELLKPRCKVCRGTPIRRESSHLFLDLARLQPLCESFVSERSISGKWSSNSTAISKSWLSEGLKPRCMTRDLKWGTPVPVPDFEDKVFYVWFDACIGYLSITANALPDSLWRQWWMPPSDSDVKLYQFMGKDNVPFHTVMFPSMLLGTVTSHATECASSLIDFASCKSTELIPQVDSLPCKLTESVPQVNCAVESSQTVDQVIKTCKWNLLHHISTTEYLRYEDGKFSKSRGIGVFGNDARDSGIPAAYWRYYLLYIRPEMTDSAFSWDDFGARINSELNANIGNLVSRVCKFAVARMGGVVPLCTGSADHPLDKELISKVNQELATYITNMDAVHIKAALRSIMTLGSIANGYLTDCGFDAKLLVSDPVRCGTIIARTLNLLYLLSAIIDPFLPSAAVDIRKNLNAPPIQIPNQWDDEMLLPGHVLYPHPYNIFGRLDLNRLGELKAKFGGRQSSI